jgi:predicted acylesterase/phospholipase RssA
LSRPNSRSHAAQFADSEAAEALHVLAGGDTEALLRRAYLGKIGIALSGGGYRASLFHIGVLARLAERDVLRGIEVLSCVSGGSILGAFYYLRVRELLQARGDDEITAGDYVELVQKLAGDFLRAVQGNARVRLIGSVKDNWKMAARSDYSRTDRVAELFETLLFSQVKKDGEGDWRMNDLFIKPSGREGFSPRYDNWERQAKVPILVLNATTLNTGHSWQFTASWMGEPPNVLDEQVDANPRLRRMYYADAPKAYRESPPRLAEAVAASACVPGLFPPIQLDDVYDGISVQLVDGGVHDNQGVASLVEQECAVMLVSDASGQMSERTDPGRGLLSVANRSNSVLMSRVRGAQLADLGGRRRAGSLRRLMVVHLKKGLPAPPFDWGHEPDDPCPEPYRPELDERAAVEATSEEDYGISEGVQRALAEIRTDLDSFSDIEAYALMAAGYRMAGHELDEQLEDFPEVFDRRPEWPFDRMLERLATPLEDDRELEVALVVGKERFGKPLRAWWRRRSRGPGRMGKAVRKVTGGLGRGAELAATPVRAIVAAPVSLIGAAGTRVYLATLGRVRRKS